MAKMSDRYYAFDKRLGYRIDLQEVCKTVCRDFDLGAFVSGKLVKEGYEDFNVMLATEQGKFFVKIFSIFRSNSECKRLVKILQRSVEEGVSTPKLLESEQGLLHVMHTSNNELRLCVTDFIQGNNFMALSHLPSLNDTKTIARQAALINSIELRPTRLDDSWCVLNFMNAYKERRRYLSAGDARLILPVLEEAKRVNFESLPHTFVHGDLVSTNVIKNYKGKIWIVDFSCSNYYPRIIELAVLTADLLLDKEKSASDSRLDVALREYQKILSLTKIELEALPVVSKMAHAMHVINTLYYKVVHGHNTGENNYFLRKGREGLRQAFEKG